MPDPQNEVSWECRRCGEGEQREIRDKHGDSAGPVCQVCETRKEQRRWA